MLALGMLFVFNFDCLIISLSQRVSPFLKHQLSPCPAVRPALWARPQAVVRVKRGTGFSEPGTEQGTQALQPLQQEHGTLPDTESFKDLPWCGPYGAHVDSASVRAFRAGSNGCGGEISESWKCTADLPLLPRVCPEPAQQPWSAGRPGSRRVVSAGKPCTCLSERDFFPVATADSR